MEPRKKINKKAVRDLRRGCGTVDDAEAIFGFYHISDLQRKTDHLISAMGGPVVFMPPGDGAIKSEYATLLAAFLTGSWK